MKKIFINSIIAAISALCFWSCSQEPYDWSQEGPTVIEEVKNSTPAIEKNSIKMETFINVTSGAKISKVIYTLLDQTQTIIEEKEGIPVEDKKGYFTVEFTELQASTTYMIQVKAYSSSSKEPVFSEGFNVTTANDDYRLITGDALDIKENSVTLVAEFSSENIKPAKEEIGIAYSINPDEVKLSSSTFVPYNSNDGNVYFVNVTDLNPGTTYYYCACMIINGKRIYAEDIRNVQLSEIQITEGELIDLGLSVKWMAYNLGGESISDYGSYYGWGNREPIGGAIQEDESNFDNISGTGYDAAWYELGEQYRIPTENDWNELIDKCQWMWVIYKGKHGYKVTGPNNNSIFLPVAGYKTDNGESGETETVGYYTIGTEKSGAKYCYSIRRTERNKIQYTYKDNISIRPVYDENVFCETGNNNNITGTSAQVTGSFKCSSNKTVSACGIWYGTTAFPHEDIGKQKSYSDNNGEISLKIDELKINTTYYYCTYVKIDGMTYYSKTDKFTTLSEVEISTEEAVDLGLSVLWRGYNLGVDSPEKINSKKYTITYTTGAPDNLCGTEYDPTVKEIGSEWHTPTREEMQELLSSRCQWIRKTYKNIEGWQVIGPSGKSIFLPMDDDTNNEDYYISAETFLQNGNRRIDAICLKQDSKYITSFNIILRGGHIRPVKNK